MARKLTFRAERAVSTLGDLPTLSFNGAEGVRFVMSHERGSPKKARVSFHDSKKEASDVLVTFGAVELSAEKFQADFASPVPAALKPYAGVDVSFAPLSEADGKAAARTLSTLLPDHGPTLKLTALDSKKLGPPIVPGGMRKKGPPQLGAESRSEWKGLVDTEFSLTVKVSNMGGPAQGLAVELGGAAIDSGLVAVDQLAFGEQVFACQKEGALVRAALPAVQIQPDIDIDRRFDKNAPKAPFVEFVLALRGLKVGAGLMTVRVIPTSTKDRAGSAMVGRMLTVAASL